VHQINLSEQLFEAVKRRAAEAGFENIDEYVADALEQQISEAENLDHLFTPERLAKIDRAAAGIAAGRGMTPDQVDAELAKRREAWRRQKS